jgi:hypothetical protein
MNNINRMHAFRYSPRWMINYIREGKPLAALRTFWDSFIGGYIGEACDECGKSYVNWYAKHDLYARVTGQTRYANGEWAPGLYCPACFDKLALNKNIHLTWQPKEFIDDGDYD